MDLEHDSSFARLVFETGWVKTRSLSIQDLIRQRRAPVLNSVRDVQCQVFQGEPSVPGKISSMFNVVLSLLRLNTMEGSGLFNHTAEILKHMNIPSRAEVDVGSATKPLTHSSMINQESIHADDHNKAMPLQLVLRKHHYKLQSRVVELNSSPCWPVLSFLYIAVSQYFSKRGSFIYIVLHEATCAHHRQYR